MTTNRDPKRSIWLLNELERLGFTDAGMAMIHHNVNGHETISSHRNYCSERREDFSGVQNRDVQRRLELMLRFHLASEIQQVPKNYFAALAHVVLLAIPIDRS